MLHYLHTKNVGPADELEMNLSPRLNIITGDNGLGKTFLLDIAWWVLTGTWPITGNGKGVVPDRHGALIVWDAHVGHELVRQSSKYHFPAATWPNPEIHQPDRANSPHNAESIVLYQRVDGGISVCDPLRARSPTVIHAYRNGYQFMNDHDRANPPGVLQFRERDIWDGLFAPDKRVPTCEGLVHDVANWAIHPGSMEFKHLSEVIAKLAANERFRLEHKCKRVYPDDARDYLLVSGPTGTFPISHAPAGLRRILGLAYLIIWLRREHTITAELLMRSKSPSILLIIDEVESHLHPKWQRAILPNLLRALAPDYQLQILATTHSPLVLASIETTFDPDQDAWLDFDLEDRAVLHKRDYYPEGEIGNWLASDAFNLAEPRSIEAKRLLLQPRP